MIQKNNPKIDVDELMALVQAEIDRQHGRGGTKEKSGQDLLVETNNPYSWAQLAPTLDIAQQNADVGTQLGTMLNYRRSIRWLARIIGKLVLYFGRVITVPQRDFNNAILHAQRITLNGIRGMNRATDELVVRLDRRFEEVARLRQQLESLEDQVRRQDQLVDYLKASLAMQERRLTLFLEEARRCLPEDTFSRNQLEELAQEQDHLLDSLYVSFEDQFRGSRLEIKKRLTVYLDLVQKAGAGSDKRPLLDIGCGRGEWLELLQEQGLHVYGVDINDTLVDQCQEQGLEAVVGEGLAHLRGLADNSLGGITGFHIIEHIPMETQLALYGECLRVLVPGGMVIFETPNPQNLLVGACNFYADPTHKRPLYPETQRFFLEYRGFTRVALKYLHPHEPGTRLPEDEAPELAARLNDLLSCARDYAVIGYKP